MFGDGKVFGVDVEPDEAANATLFCGERGVADAYKWVEHDEIRPATVDFDAVDCELDRESRGMWPVFGAAHDCFVGDEPVVAPAAEIFSVGVTPPGDIGFVNVRDTEAQAVNGRVAIFCEVEDILLTVGNIPWRIERFEMPGGDLLAVDGLDGNGFDPVEGVLEDEGNVVSSQGQQQLVREKRVGRGSADVEKEGAVFLEDALDGEGPGAAPGEVIVARLFVFVFSIVDSEIIGRRGNDEVDGRFRQFGHAFEAIGGLECENGFVIAGGLRGGGELMFHGSAGEEVW